MLVIFIYSFIMTANYIDISKIEKEFLWGVVLRLVPSGVTKGKQR